MDNGLVQFRGCCLAPELGQLRPLGLVELEDEDRIQVDPTIEVEEVGERVYLRKPGWFFGVSVPRWLWEAMPRTSCERMKNLYHRIECGTADRSSARTALLYLEAWQVFRVWRTGG